MTDAVRSAPLSRLAAMAVAGRLPPSLLFTGPSGAPTEAAALRLAATENCSAPGDPDAAKRLLGRILETDAIGRGERRRKKRGAREKVFVPYRDVTILRPETAAGRLTGPGPRQIRVKQIREAVAACQARPFEGRRRFLILVGADEMNPAAANALLKTLEEPHPWLVLILCATRESRLLATIVSRCQRWRFQAPTPAETAGWLQAEHDIPAREARLAALAAGGDRDRALAFDRGDLLRLDREAAQIAVVAVRGIVPARRMALTQRLSRLAPPGGRRAGDAPNPLEILLLLLRSRLRDFAAIASEAPPFAGALTDADRKLAGEAPPASFVAAYELASQTARDIFEFSGNRRMQLDAMLLGFNRIARPLMMARLRARRR